MQTVVLTVAAHTALVVCFTLGGRALAWKAGKAPPVRLPWKLHATAELTTTEVTYQHVAFVFLIFHSLI